MQLQRRVVGLETSVRRTGISLITEEKRGVVSATWSAGGPVRQSHSSERGSWGREEQETTYFALLLKIQTKDQ